MNTKTEYFVDPEIHSKLGLQCEVVRLQALLETSRKVHGTIHLDDVLNCALEIAVKELEAESAFFVSGPALGTTRCTQYGKVPADVSTAVHSDSSSIPLLDKQGDLLTRLVVLRPGIPMSLEEQDFLEGLALQTSVAIENARQHKALLEWERVQQDLAAARAIQRSLLPQAMPEIEGYDAAFRATTCYEVGGDYVDVVAGEEGRYMMVVADVAGKGLASALVGASFRSAFRAMAVAGLDPTDLATRMNALHYEEGPEARRRYVTAILLRLDVHRNEVEVVNAGHNPGILVERNGNCHLLEASGTPLGLLPGMQYRAERHKFEPGTRLLFYTDGLTEVFQEDEEFGLDRLTALVRDCVDQDCGPMLDRIWQELSDFARTNTATDDMTALSVMRRWNGDTAA